MTGPFSQDSPHSPSFYIDCAWHKSATFSQKIYSQEKKKYTKKTYISLRDPSLLKMGQYLLHPSLKEILPGNRNERTPFSGTGSDILSRSGRFCHVFHQHSTRFKSITENEDACKCTKLESERFSEP